MQVYEVDRKPLFEGTWTTITAAKGFDPLLLDIPKNATHWVRYTNGATAAISAEETLTGGTSNATCVLVGVAVEVGTAGAGDTGIIFVRSPSAAFEAETLTGGISTGTVDIIQDFIPLRLGVVHPKAALISVETASLNVSVTKTIPTITAGTNHGITIVSGGGWALKDIDAIRNFRAINAVNASGAIMKYVLYA
jgi:hypothetical protein